MFKDNPRLYGSDLQMAKEVLAEVAEKGVDGLRIGTVASRLDLSVATAYRRWGGPRLLLQHAWQICINSLDRQVMNCIKLAPDEERAIDELWYRLWLGMPDPATAFLELHSARRRWYRGDLEPSGLVVPSLETWVQLGQQKGFIRSGHTRTLAGILWAVTLEAFGGEGRGLIDRTNFCLGALKRLLLTPEAFAREVEHTIDGVDVSESSAWNPDWEELASR